MGYFLKEKFTMSFNNSNANLIGRPDNGSTIYLYFVSIVAAVSGLLFGFDGGVITGALPFITRHFNLNTHQEGFAVSNLVIGCIVGASFAGTLTDRFGRKKILIFVALFYIVSAIYSGFSRTYIDLITARFLGGLAIGMGSVVSPMYISEIAPAKIRGRLTALNQLTIVSGILVVYFTNWLLVDIGPNNWRWMFIAEAFPASVFFFAVFFIPESPRWLIKMGKIDNALDILSRVGGRKHAEEVVKEIKTTIEKEEGTITELFKPGLRMALIVGILLAFFGHMCGINAVTYYSPKIFMRAGYENASSAFLATIMVAVTLLIFTIVTIFVIDKLGRKPLLLIGSLGMAISFAFTGFAFQHQSISGIWVVFSIISYIAFFAISMGGVIWVYLPEIFPNKVRGRAMSIATIVLWLTEFIVAQTFPWLVEKIEGRTFYLYSAVCAVSLVFVWFMIKETKGKTLEEIEKMWGKY
ncbi:MAG TPA: MFS transporter [bacterium]|nr:MFS transporter [bacterium]